MRARTALLALTTLFACLACDPGEASSDAGRLDGSSADAASVDASTELDGGTGEDAGGADAGSPPCTDPPGSACNPIVIDTFPFAHSGDTSSASEDTLDGYACAPSVDEQGPEVHYELRLAAPRRVSFALEESAGVDVDLHVLRSPTAESCIARGNTTLEQPLGAGSWRVVVDTFHSAGADRSGAYVLTVDVAEPARRTLGILWNTYYFLADEDDHTGPQDTPIYDAGCTEIARVRQDFHDSVCIEGSGVLSDDRVINYATSCTTSCPAARTCGSASYRICYSVLDPIRYPWGLGAGSRPLVPDRSMAVDTSLIALGTWVYFEELDGLIRPGTSEPHDGCLRADDVGGAIIGNHFDFFAGTRARWLEWEASLPTRSDLNAWVDDPRCYPSP